MTNEELNTKLYEKMFAEQEKYRSWLLTLSSGEMLNHAYEYVMREDILLALEYHDLLHPNTEGHLRMAYSIAYQLLGYPARF